MFKSGDLGQKLISYGQIVDFIQKNSPTSDQPPTQEEIMRILGFWRAVSAHYQSDVYPIFEEMNKLGNFPNLTPTDMPQIVQGFKTLVETYLASNPKSNECESLVDLLTRLNEHLKTAKTGQSATSESAELKKLREENARLKAAQTTAKTPVLESAELKKLREENAALVAQLAQLGAVQRQAQGQSTQSTVSSSSSMFNNETTSTQIINLIKTVEDAKKKYDASPKGGTWHIHGDTGTEKVQSLLNKLRTSKDLNQARTAFVTYFCDNSWFGSTKCNNHSFCSFWFNELRNKQELVRELNSIWFKNSAQKLSISTSIDYTEGANYENRKTAFDAMQSLGSTTAPSYGFQQ
ncbi:MAG: hypothetical protein AB7F64_08275 [Gammaproteobacteria bacterium]